jgi:hypothetical protein
MFAVLAESFELENNVDNLMAYVTINIVTDLINALPGNSSVNMVQHATIDDAVFSMSSARCPVLVADNELAV